QSSLQCIDGSSCVNQQCACVDSSKMIINAYCLSPGAGCSQTQTRANGQCISFVKPGWTCRYEAQCVGGSTCKNNVCTCPTGTTEMHQYCIRSGFSLTEVHKLGDYCDPTEGEEGCPEHAACLRLPNSTSTM
ncbi:hypothetical protein PMAYCL1PPCAC_10554, partial [Pristionchus mayeri]